MKKYYIWVLGCAMNYSDAERLSAVLETLGYKRVEKEAEADLIVVVACSVRQTAIDRIYGKAKLWKRQKSKNPKLKIALSGCVLEKDRKNMQEIFDLIFDIKNLGKLPALLSHELGAGMTNNDLKLNNLDLFNNLKFKTKNYENDYFQVSPKYESHFRAFVPISTGCNNFCTYCAVPYTRGREKSREAEDILKEISSLIKAGYKEITLLGQNVNSYGSDFEKKKNWFVELLRKIDGLEGNYRVYFYSNHPKDMSDELIKLMPKLKHFPKYIHLPLQSGNDEIIKNMNRHYTKEKYLDLVAKIKKEMPDVTLTTDIIVGFPGETEKQFADTVEVMEWVGFDMAFMARYSPRPQTLAAKLVDDVSADEKKKREDVLQKILEKSALENNQKFVGKTVRVLFDEIKGNKIYGRTEGFKVVEVSGSTKTDRENLIGQFGEVKIESASAWKLIGRLCA